MFKGKPKFTKGENIMKKTKRISSFILVAVMCLSVFIGLTRNNTVTEINADSNSNVTVGVSLTSLDNAAMSTITTYIQSLYQNSNVTVTVRDAQNNSNTQISQLTEFIVQGVNAIVVKPVNENALVTTLDNAADQGIVVIVIGRNNNKFKSAVYVDFDYEGAVRSAVNDFIENYWDQSGEFDIIIFACDNDHGDAYLDIVLNMLLNYSNVTKHIFRIANVSEIDTHLQEWLADEEHSGLPDTIFNCCEANAEKTKEHLLSAGFTFGDDGIPIYGFRDYAQDIKDMIDTIKDLLDGIFINGDSIPVNQLFLIDIFRSGGWGSL